MLFILRSTSNFHLHASSTSCSRITSCAIDFTASMMFLITMLPIQLDFRNFSSFYHSFLSFFLCPTSKHTVYKLILTRIKTKAFCNLFMNFNFSSSRLFSQHHKNENVGLSQNSFFRWFLITKRNNEKKICIAGESKQTINYQSFRYIFLSFWGICEKAASDKEIKSTKLFRKSHLN